MTHQPPEPKEQQEKWPPRVIIPRAEVFAEGGFGTYFAVWDPKEPFLTSPTEDFEYLSLEEHSARLESAKAQARAAAFEAAAGMVGAFANLPDHELPWTSFQMELIEQAAKARAPEAGKEKL